MDKICRTCRAFCLDLPSDEFGECRLYPPQNMEFPEVETTWWCAQWQLKDTPRRNGVAPTVSADDFNQFWALYPKKIGKKAAHKAFQNAQDRPRIDDLLQAIHRAKQSPQWAKDNGQYIPHPATWLNRGQWADVPTETKPSVFEEFLARGERDDEPTGVFEGLAAAHGATVGAYISHGEYEPAE